MFGDFLIDGENCKIPNLSPFSTNAMKVFKRVRYESCYDMDPITFIHRDENGHKLMIDKKAIKSHIQWYMTKITVNQINFNKL